VPRPLCAFALAWLVLSSGTSGQAQLRPDPRALAQAAPDLLSRVRADPYNYFRLINREWIARVCEIFAADLPGQPIAQLHGDAHIEQYALMNDAWGLDDFDDSARGPALIDIVRFLGSIDLATRQRGWTRDRDSLFDRFIAGYRRGLADPAYRPPRPEIVRRLRTDARVPTREAFLAWGETQMAPMSDESMNAVAAAMEVFARAVRRERPDLSEGYFRISRAGWLHLGVGSAAGPKILMRVQGSSADPADDVLLEAKALRSLDGVGCLEPTPQTTLRVIAGSQQIGRLKHNILAAAPDLAIPEVATRGEHRHDWWVRSWDPSYREIGLKDFRSVRELSSIVYDSGVQLGAGSFRQQGGSQDGARRKRSLASLEALRRRLGEVAKSLVEELLREWTEPKNR
jgi:hypothetical protein